MNDERIAELQSLLPRCLTHDWVRLGARMVRLLRDHHHPRHHDSILERLLSEARRSVELCEFRRLHVPSVSYPESLPITARKAEIISAIRAHPVVVIAGETGSGKTTQIPKMCLEAGLGIEAMIGCTQPRRVAALSISRRIAEELAVPWGREVGCKIRFDDRSGPETYVKLMTDGILLAETQGDPLLAEYNALIIDEAHERSLNIDFLLGYLKGLLAQRNDLKLIITSATIDTAAFSRAFSNAPVIEVSGRTFPVEVKYEPLDAESEERGDETFVDAAVRTSMCVVSESTHGDLLIFLPGERDIRETAASLDGRLGHAVEVVPLFGRLSAGDQHRVFEPSLRRKIVVATNIAETSLTIPGIRFVIDVGLARVSRYNPRTRTRRLPIEPISQSSANQRKGRAGRVEAGVCIRLYSEEDFDARPPQTQPEIQRANLAEVILRMKAFRLGEIETFPFLNPPAQAAIAGGYVLLQELGALDAGRELTPLGRDLARLPIDPTLGRMLLQSRHEHTTRELLIIASGLSIQDPRERPLDQQAAADAAHRRHIHPQSDFLSLLNLWRAVHEEWEQLRTQGQRRKFCRAQFLSYLRMREWQDLEAQLEGALEDLVLLSEPARPGPLNSPVSSTEKAGGPGDLSYDAIHRSILAGLLGHVAVHQERNQYKTAGNREVTLFPGSALFARTDSAKKPGSRSTAPTTNVEKPRQPRWIVAGEIVETSQLFARTVAAIDPEWIPDLAPHLVKITHHHPRWVTTAGQVLIDEVTTWQGLEVRRRRVAFGNLDRKAANALFIRSALVEEELLVRNSRDEEPDIQPMRGSSSASREAIRELPSWLRFLEHNHKLRERVETWQTRTRHRAASNVDQALFDFYSAHLTDVSSLNELRQWLTLPGHHDALCATEAHLTGGTPIELDSAAFPESIDIGGQSLALRYAYAPGEERDGVTVRLPFALVDSVSPALLDWAIPGLRADLVEEWLRALPKSVRRELQPIAPKVEQIVRELSPTGPTLGHDLARFLQKHFGIAVGADAVATESIAQHLRPRVEILGPSESLLAAGRNLPSLRAALPKTSVQRPTETDDWKRAAQQWERFGLTTWNFAGLPERIELPRCEGPPRIAWLGLEREGEHVNLKLFPSPQSARRATADGWPRLIESALQKDLAWLQKDLRSLAPLAPFYAVWGPSEELQETAFAMLRRYVVPRGAPASLARSEFDAAVSLGKTKLPGLAIQLRDLLKQVLELRQQIAARLGIAAAPKASRTTSPPGKQLIALGDLIVDAKLRSAQPPVTAAPFVSELNALLPARFLETIPFTRLPHVVRYLKALLIRIERARQNPRKDSERALQVAPFVAAWREMSQTSSSDPEFADRVADFRWMIEEFKVSLFAQELGTAVPVSAKRLAEHLDRLRVEN